MMFERYATGSDVQLLRCTVCGANKQLAVFVESTILCAACVEADQLAKLSAGFYAVKSADRVLRSDQLATKD